MLTIVYLLKIIHKIANRNIHANINGLNDLILTKIYQSSGSIYKLTLNVCYNFLQTKIAELLNGGKHATINVLTIC